MSTIPPFVAAMNVGAFAMALLSLRQVTKGKRAYWWLVIGAMIYLWSPAANAFTLPAPEVGFGFYYSPGRCKYANERQYFADMKAHGCNTLTVQANDLPGQSLAPAPENLARQLNTAASVGLMDYRFPVICYSADAQIVLDTLKLRSPGVRWPELVVQSIDEPNQTQERDLRDYRDKAHAAGLRIGTAIAGYNCLGYHQTLPWCKPEDELKWVPPVGQYLDIWVVLVGTLTKSVRTEARRQGVTLGAYLAYPASPVLDRWTFGLWAWKARTRLNLFWAYIDPQAGWDYSRVTETPTGPVDRPGGAGYAEGILDYRVLQGVRDLHSAKGDKWLAGVEAQTDLGWWPRGYVAPPTEQAAQVPTVDLDRVRREGLALLRGR